jgi:glycosyltransferase involved in cell wall biosynthesis
VPAVYTIHDLPPAHFSDEGYLPSWSKSAANQAEAIVTPSEFGKREIIEHLNVNPERVHVVPNGCEHDLFNTSVVPMTAKELDAQGVPVNFIFYAGGSTRRKNVLALLEAWASISSDYPDLHLVLAGPAEGLKALSVKSGAPRVVVLGYVEHQLMPRIMKAAKAFVFPSIYEGFGLPPMEAMALGVPTIGTLAGGAVPEVIGDAGILAEDGSAKALAEAIKRLLDDPQLSEQLRHSGPHRVRNLPSWAEHAKNVVSVYKSILS